MLSKHYHEYSLILLKVLLSVELPCKTKNTMRKPHSCVRILVVRVKNVLS